jgi:hypothetical protein
MLEFLVGSHLDLVYVLLLEATHPHRARQMTSSRGRVSCDIWLASNEIPGFIYSIRSRRYIRGKTLRWWNPAATMPTVSPRKRSLLCASRRDCSFG